MRTLVVAGIFVIGVTGATVWAAEPTVVRGQASCREKVDLPADAVFEATLEHVSQTDAAGDVLETVRVQKVTGLPIRFEIPYDPSKINDQHSYRVRGRILENDHILLRTDQVYPVLTHGSDNETNLLLVPAGTSN